ncbi:MAG TPA: NrsF family protein, partial [Advenella sp.]|nr:NrsF family protein [Advenella sp.]
VRPGVAVASAWLRTILPIITMMLGTILFILTAPPEFRLKLVSSTSLWSIAIGHTMLLSLPSFIAMIHAMKGLAPTRLALSGAAAGLLAGAQGVLIYALYCPDMPAPYWSALQIAAMFMTTAIGAALGPSCLRW